MKALVTQQLLRENGIDFFGNNEWPGNSPGLNACEHLGAVRKDRVENLLIERFPANNARLTDLNAALQEALEGMKNDTDSFEALLMSYPERLCQVRSQSGHTDFESQVLAIFCFWFLTFLFLVQFSRKFHKFSNKIFFKKQSHTHARLS